MNSNSFSCCEKRPLSGTAAEVLALLRLRGARDQALDRARLSAAIASQLGKRAVRHRDGGDLDRAAAVLELELAALKRAIVAVERARA